jgi:hypothetical protein
MGLASPEIEGLHVHHPMPVATMHHSKKNGDLERRCGPPISEEVIEEKWFPQKTLTTYVISLREV